jgi:hypothetical protein
LNYLKNKLKIKVSLVIIIDSNKLSHILFDWNGLVIDKLHVAADLVRYFF